MGRIAAQEGGEWHYYLHDGLGNVRQLAGPAGEVVRAQGYTPFSVPLWSMGSATSSYGFTGEQWDAGVALLYLRARYIAKLLGRTR